MLQCETFSVLLLVGVCLSAWAAPLGSTSSPQARRCNRKEQETRETSEHQHENRLCVKSSLLPASSPHVEEWQEPGGAAEVLARDEEEFAVADEVKGPDRQAGLVQKGDEAHAWYKEGFSESTKASLVDKDNTYLPASPTEAIPVVERTSGSVNAEMESVTSTSVVDPINSGKHTLQKVGLSVVPFQPSTDRSAEAGVVLGHSDFNRQRSLLYTDLEEDKGSEQVFTTDLPQEQEGGLAAETLKKNRSAQLNHTEPPFMVSSIAHDSASQSPWTIINPAATALTASDSTNGEDGGSRVAKASLFTATELQDKALAHEPLQPDLTLTSRLPELGGTWTEALHIQGVEETSILPLSQEVGTEATMSSEDLPLIFEPLDDVTPPSGSAMTTELSVAMAPATGMLGEAELERTVSVDTEHIPPDASLLGPSDWPSPWQMSGSENLEGQMPSQMPVNMPFSEAKQELSEATERLQSVTSASMGTLLSTPSPVSDTTQQVIDIELTHSAVLKMKPGLQENLESEEDDDEEDEDADEYEEEEEDSDEDMTEATVHTPTRPSYSLIPPPPVWGQQNQGLIRSWVELIREKAGYVSGMLVPVGIGITGALLIVGALYSIRMIHRKRKNSFKHQRRKQPKEVRNGPDQAMLLADSSEDEF